jgi:hypothetical protein
LKTRKPEQERVRYGTRKTFGAVVFVDQEGREVGRVHGKAQRASRAMAAGPDALALLKNIRATGLAPIFDLEIDSLVKWVENIP